LPNFIAAGFKSINISWSPKLLLFYSLFLSGIKKRFKNSPPDISLFLKRKASTIDFSLTYNGIFYRSSFSEKENTKAEIQGFQVIPIGPPTSVDSRWSKVSTVGYKLAGVRLGVLNC
jgi:hypothetical protein